MGPVLSWGLLYLKKSSQDVVLCWMSTCGPCSVVGRVLLRAAVFKELLLGRCSLLAIVLLWAQFCNGACSVAVALFKKLLLGRRSLSDFVLLWALFCSGACSTAGGFI